MLAAIVPAAGHSQRMGRPKLILPVGGATVIARVIAALTGAGADPVVVVTPPRGAPGVEVLCGEATAAGAVVVTPDAQPLDMRASVEIALGWLAAASVAPRTILLTPADSPGLTPALAALVVRAARERSDAVVIPTFQGKRGHPVAFPGDLIGEVRGLPPGVGVNALIALHADRVVELAVDDPSAVADLDTPEDYERWASAYPAGSTRAGEGEDRP